MVVRCYGQRTGFPSIDFRCGWVGDHTQTKRDSLGAELCPKCGSRTDPTPKGTKEPKQ